MHIRGKTLDIAVQVYDIDGTTPIDCDTGYPMYEEIDPAGKVTVASTNTGNVNLGTGKNYKVFTPPILSPPGTFVYNIILSTGSSANIWTEQQTREVL
jgi:hypothetical protein